MLFKFENAHIVRECSTLRCSKNIHGHSYKVEVLLESNYLDNGQMVYDFGLTKIYIKEIIDSFDHAITLWSRDDKRYIDDIKRHSLRWHRASQLAHQLNQFLKSILKLLYTIDY